MRLDLIISTRFKTAIIAIEERMSLRISLNIKHAQEFRNYKVNFEKAANVLSFHPQEDVKSIIDNLPDNMEKFRDWDNPRYSNIRTFRYLENGIEVPVGAA